MASSSERADHYPVRGLVLNRVFAVSEGSVGLVRVGGRLGSCRLGQETGKRRWQRGAVIAVTVTSAAATKRKDAKHTRAFLLILLLPPRNRCRMREENP